MNHQHGPLTIQYRFRFPNGRGLDFELHLDPVTLARRPDTTWPLPSWTALEFHQCPNCPLDPAVHPDCPAAANLRSLVEWCGQLWSYDSVRVEVVTPQRVVSKDTSVQAGVSSLVGLTMATSGCPHTAFFRPMARFHLPFPSTIDTIYRATSMYLLAQYFRRKEGGEPDLDLNGLADIYRNLQIINTAMAARLRAATEKDAAVNAVIILDVFAQTLPLSISDSLEEIRHLFTAFLAAGGRPGPAD